VTRARAALALRHALGRLGERLAGWGYREGPAGGSSRDLRIDLLRGFCVFVMIVDHVGGESSWLYVLTGGNRFMVSAAEGFVLLSGIAMGMVHRKTIDRQGIRPMFAKIAKRAWLLYVLAVVLTLIFAAVSSLLGTPWAANATPATGKLDFALSVLTLHRTYSLTDILVLYTLLVIAAGPVLLLLARGYTTLVLTLSFAIWAAAQLWPASMPRAWQIIDGGFPFAAWQVMFFVGLAIGYHRARLARHLRPARLVALGVAAVVALAVIQLLTINVLEPSLHGSFDVQELLFDKNDARIGRILALFAAASFAYAFVTVAWTPVRRWTGWLLLTMGQRSLFAYGVQLFVVAFWSSELMAPVRLDRENALFQGSAVLMVWAACALWPRIAPRLRSASRPRATDDRVLLPAAA
jgi:hypothetical protein